MTRLPDAAWWNDVQFSVGQAGGQQGGFAMSRDEMTELLRLAENMVQQIHEQYAAQRAMVEIELPAPDPASAGYVGTADRRGPMGASGAGEAYTSRLRAQADFLNRLIAKLYAALSTVEAADMDNVGGIRQVGPMVRDI